jgi:hypothetical protein
MEEQRLPFGRLRMKVRLGWDVYIFHYYSSFEFGYAVTFPMSFYSSTNSINWVVWLNKFLFQKSNFESRRQRQWFAWDLPQSMKAREKRNLWLKVCANEQNHFLKFYLSFLWLLSPLPKDISKPENLSHLENK